MTQPNKLAITYRKLDTLLPYARNARTHSDAQVEQLAASMRTFGFTNPALIDEHGGLIAGHARVMAARRCAVDEIPCIALAGLTESQKRAYALADNRIAELGGWDDETLAGELSDLRIEGFDLDLTGFDDGDIGELIDLTENLPEKTEALRPIKWTRILLSIPAGAAVDGIDSVFAAVVAAGGRVDHAGN